MGNYTKEILTTKDREILRKILKEENNDNWVYCYAALNPNCPPEALTEVLKRGKNDWVSWYAVSNPNCSPEMLVEILKREKDDHVSYYAAKNENCPDEDRINWMMKLGKIEKEDPSKHIIEYEEIKVEDFQDLKDLLKNC